MPNPLIIIEMHSDPAAKILLAQNAKALKDLGYTRFLYEMDSRYTYEDCRRLFLSAINDPRGDKLTKRTCQVSLDYVRFAASTGVYD